MKLWAFAKRNALELLRDPMNYGFGIGFPVVVMLLLTAIQANIPVSLFEIERLAPGMAVFGLSFVSLFSGMLLARDRSTSFLLRLYASPLKPLDYIVSYTVPMLPMAVLQAVACFLAAFCLGLRPGVSLLVTLAVLLPAAVLFIAIGLLAGSIFTDKQVGGLCGALLTNVTAWLSGIWFDLDLLGGAFRKIAYALPFARAVNAAEAAAAGRYAAVFPDLFWVTAYAAVILAAAILVFRLKMKSEKL